MMSEEYVNHVSHFMASYYLPLVALTLSRIGHLVLLGRTAAVVYANITITAFLPRQSALREARCRGHSIDAHLAWLVDVYEKLQQELPTAYPRATRSIRRI